MTNPWLLRLFPFLGWFPVNSTILRGDIIAGITGALVLVPKAMAYAQLAGLPVYFGLYTAFVPAILGALWGSSRQLATGPVAVVSLMTAAAVAPLAVPMSEEFVGMVLLLTLMVGVIQFSLGALSLGTIVNFVSHPVILGFMNAAAIIIALSQLDMLLGIPKGRSDFFLKDIWEMFGYLPMTHLPTLAMSVFALALMLGLKKIAPKPSVLIAVVITAIVSYAVAFEHNTRAGIDQVMDSEVRGVIEQAATHETRATAIITEINAKQTRIKQVEKDRNRARADADRIIAARRYDTSPDAGTMMSTSEYDNTIAALHYEVELLQSSLRDVEDRSRNAVRTMRKFTLDLVPGGNGEPDRIYLKGRAPQDAKTDGRSWHIKKIEKGAIKLVGGGDVVGTIPTGLPSFRMPPLGLDTMMQLLSAALIIALVAFMESISMAKAMATKSKQRIDPNQELIGQGIANMGGAFFQSYPACGSFTGSAINLQAGAKTGFAMVFNGLFVAVTLLFLTPFLYHLPKAVLAVIILLAVTGLITPMALKHTWQASRLDGIVAAATFVLTLLAAPHLDKGILIGAALAIILYLYRTMAPRVAILGRFHDGTLRDVKVNPNLATSKHVVAMRFDGSLYFANIAHFEDAVLEAVANHKEAKYLLVVGDGINQLDASGEEVMHHLVERLRDAGVEIVFSGLKKQILDVMRSTGLFALIGQQNIFPTENQALAAIYEHLGSEAADDLLCPVPARWAKADSTAPTASRKAV